MIVSSALLKGTNKFLEAGGGEFSSNPQVETSYTESYDFDSDDPDRIGTDRTYSLEVEGGDPTGGAGNGGRWREAAPRRVERAEAVDDDLVLCAELVAGPQVHLHARDSGPGGRFRRRAEVRVVR